MDREIISFSALGVRVMVSRMFLIGLKVFSAMEETWTLVQDLLLVLVLILLVTFVRVFGLSHWQLPFIVGTNCWPGGSTGLNCVLRTYVDLSVPLF